MADALSVVVLDGDGKWQTLGSDRLPGIYPEGVRPEADAQGSAAGAFQIRRDPDANHPDLGAWTPTEMWHPAVDVPIWEGRIKETPAQGGDDKVINVSAQGWMQHFEDDAIDKGWVHADQTQWRDMRSFSEQPLGPAGVAAGMVTTTEAGQINIGWPKGAQTGAGSWVGVALDLGPDPRRWATGAMCYLYAPSRIAASGSYGVYLRGTGTGNIVAAFDPAGDIVAGIDITGIPTASTGIHKRGSFTKPARFVSLFVYDPAGHTVAEDNILSVFDLLVFTDYVNQESQYTSTLRASEAITDVVQYAPLLKQPATRDSNRFTDEAKAAPNVVSQYRFNETAGAVMLDEAPVNAGSPINGTYVGGPSLAQAAVMQADPDDPANAAVTFAPASSKYGALPIPASGASTDLSNGGSGRSFAIIAVLTVPTIPAAGFAGIYNSVGTLAAGKTLWAGFNSSYAAQLSFFGDDLISANNAVAPGQKVCMLYTYAFDVDTSWIFVNGVQVATGANGPLTGLPTDIRVGMFTTGQVALASQPAAFTIDELVIVSAGSMRLHDAAYLYEAALNRQTGDIRRTSFAIQHFFPDGLKSPRENLDAVDSYHRFRKRIEPGRRFTYKPFPASPTLVVGPDVEFDDSNANSGVDVYNKCVVEGADGDGTPVRIARFAWQQAGAPVPSEVSGLAMSNPRADTALTGWAATGGTLTRDTTVFRSAPASFKHAVTASGQRIDAAAGIFPTGVFLAGIQYWLRFFIQPSADPTAAQALRASFGVLTGTDFATLEIPHAGGTSYIPGTRIASRLNVQLPAGIWSEIRVPWTPQATRAASAVAVRVETTTFASAVSYFYDDFGILQSFATVVDKRGFIRTKILTAQSAIDGVAGQVLADAFLASQMRQPFKGQFVAERPGDVSELKGGRPLHPAELTLRTSELILIPRDDPDTGERGRAGRIASVQFDPDAGAATVSIDDDRSNLEALMARMAVVQG